MLQHLMFFYKIDTQLKFEFEKEGARGPSHWGELKQEWKAHGNGKHQSPNDLV